MVQSHSNQVVSTDSERFAHELSHSQTVELDITIPDGSQPGDMLSLEVNGQMLEVAVPEGAVGGSIITIAVPADNDASATSEGVSAEGDQDEKAMSPTSNTVELEITIPEGSNPGDILSVEVNGEMLEVTVPEGATGGTVITIDVPTDDTNASPSASSPHAQVKEDAANTSTAREAVEKQDDTAHALGENKQATTPGHPVAQAGHEVIVDAAPPAEKPGTEQGVSAEGDQDEKAMSPTSNTVELEITIPEGSNPGDILSVEVNGEMLEVTVPEGATGGTVITIDVPTDDTNASPSASSPHAQAEYNAAADLPQLAEGSVPEDNQDEKAMSPTSNTVELEITIPEGSNPGDILSVEVNGEMLEVTVPEGATGGTVITIDVPTDDTNASPSASSPHAQVKEDAANTSTAREAGEKQDDTAHALGENKQATTPSDPLAQAGHEVVVDAAPPAEKPGTEQDAAIAPVVGPAVQPDVPKPEEASTQEQPTVAADPPITTETAVLEQKEDAAIAPVVGPAVQPDLPKPEEASTQEDEAIVPAVERVLEADTPKPEEASTQERSTVAADPLSTAETAVLEQKEDAAIVPAVEPANQADISKPEDGSIQERSTVAADPLSTAETAVLEQKEDAATVPAVEPADQADISKPEEASTQERSSVAADPLSTEETPALEQKEDVAIADPPSTEETPALRQKDVASIPVVAPALQPDVPQPAEDRSSVAVGPSSIAETSALEQKEHRATQAVQSSTTLDVMPRDDHQPAAQDEAHLLPLSPTETQPVEPQATTIEVGITVPVGCSPGDTFRADWNGQQVTAVVPPGCSAGSVITVEVQHLEEPRTPQDAMLHTVHDPNGPNEAEAPEAIEAISASGSLVPMSPSEGHRVMLKPHLDLGGQARSEPGSPLKRPATHRSVAESPFNSPKVEKKREWTGEEMAAGKWLAEADAVLICCGSGSRAAPLQAAGGRVYSNEEDFARQYPSMCDWGYKTAVDCSEILNDGKLSIYERWAFWAEHTEKMNEIPMDEDTLDALAVAVGEKDYFVYSFTAESFFHKAGFDSRRIYSAAGSWEFLQCAKACSSSSVFPSSEAVHEILSNLREYSVVTNDCLPKCSHCGGDCIPNVRLTDKFCHERYSEGLSNLISWLEEIAASKTRLVIVELDSAFKANRLSAFPMESIAADLASCALVRFSNERYPWVPAVLSKAVGLPTKSFHELPELLAHAESADGQMLSVAAEKEVEQAAESRKVQRQERDLSVEPIHWRRILQHLGEDLFNCAYERSM